MKKKSKAIIIIVIILLLVILVFPLKMKYKDGGTIEYRAILYKIIKWNTLDGITGTDFYIFPNNMKSVDYYREQKSISKIKYEKYEGYYFNYNVIEKITKKEDIGNILNKNNNLKEEIVTKLNSYDDEYFNNKDLIVIYAPLSSGTYKSEFKSILNNEKIEVNIYVNYTDYGTTDMSGYLYLIEYEKTNKELKVNVDSNKNKQELKSCEFSRTFVTVDVAKKDDDECVSLKLLRVDYLEDIKQPFDIVLCGNKVNELEQGKLYKFTFVKSNEVTDASTRNNDKDIFSDYGFISVVETEEFLNEDICKLD